MSATTAELLDETQRNSEACRANPAALVHYRAGRHCPAEARIIAEAIEDWADVPAAAAKFDLTTDQIHAAWSAFKQYRDNGCYDRETSR